MAKHKHHQDPTRGRKALAYGSVEGFGPMLNVRHPRKFKPGMPDKTTPSCPRKDDGR